VIQNRFAEFLDRLSRNLAMREHYTMEDYQCWLDHNPVCLHSGAVERIQLRDRLTLDGTNDLFRASYWIARPGSGDRHGGYESTGGWRSSAILQHDGFRQTPVANHRRDRAEHGAASARPDRAGPFDGGCVFEVQSRRGSAASPCRRAARSCRCRPAIPVCL